MVLEMPPLESLKPHEPLQLPCIKALCFSFPGNPLAEDDSTEIWNSLSKHRQYQIQAKY